MKIIGKTFSPPMVLAMLQGWKSQTRRISKWRVAPGDLVYVREHWSTSRDLDKIKPTDLEHDAPITYLASHSPLVRLPYKLGKHRQAMHMPRWASRLYNEVLEVRTEPLQDLSEADALQEGLYPCVIDKTQHWKVHEKDQIAFADPVAAYRSLWNLLNDEDGNRWEDNPEISVISFKTHMGNVDVSRN